MLKATRDGANWIWSVAVAIVAALFAVWGLRHTAGYSWGFDESTILLTGRELARGVRLYDPMWWNYPPLFLWQVGAVMRLSGESIIAARALAVAWSTLFLLVTAALAGRIAGGPAALASALLILLSPHFVEFSRAVMADIATTTLATLAICIALQPAARRQPLWDAMAGATGALAALSKLTMLPLAPALAAALLIHPTWRGRITRLAVALASGLIVAVAVLSQTPIGAFFEQVIGFQTDTLALAFDPIHNAQEIWHFFSAPRAAWPSPLVLLSLPGIVYACIHRRTQPAGPIAGLALITAIIAYSLYHPLYEHHLLMLAPTWAALGGVGAAWLINGVTVEGNHRQERPRWPRLALALTLGAATVFYYQPWHIYSKFAAPHVETRARLGPLLAAAWRATLPPGSRIMSDDPMLILLSGHQAVPGLINLSNQRLNGGPVRGLATILPHLESSPPDVIAVWTSRLRHLEGFLEWVQPRYMVVAAYGDGDRRIYQRWQPPTQGPIATIGDWMYLRVYELNPPSLPAGSTLTVTVAYQIVQPPPEDLLITAHIEQGDQIFAYSEQPVGTTEMRPKLLLPGDHIVRTFQLALTDDIPVGDYRVRIGVRRPMTPEDHSIFLAQHVHVFGGSTAPSPTTEAGTATGSDSLRQVPQEHTPDADATE